MTRLLYYEDPDALAFDATIREVRRREGHTEVILDATAFYPEGGGQPSDVGEINGLPVVHVRKEEHDVVHVLRSDQDAGKLANAPVHGLVDAAHRRDYRQQHSGQHILSAALMAVNRYETVSVHQGDEYTTIEIAAAEIPPADLEEVERIANEAIEADLAVTATWVTDDEVGSYPLRRPPKVSGSIRIVQVGELDCVACGGVHVNRTGEIRLVRAISVETIRGHARIAWKIGDRAIADYVRARTIVSDLTTALSAQPDEIVERVQRNEARTRELELEARRLRSRIHGLVARSLLADEEDDASRWIVTAEFEDEPRDFLRGVTEELVAHHGVAACLTNRSEGRLQWSVGIAPGSRLEFDAVRAELLPIIEAKGGGKPPIWQGVGSKPEAAHAFLTAFRRLGEAAAER
ncbi:MAG: alanyl-tRNA editing protein [Spirochaetota bacterium]